MAGSQTVPTRPHPKAPGGTVAPGHGEGCAGSLGTSAPGTVGPLQPARRPSLAPALEAAVAGRRPPSRSRPPFYEKGRTAQSKQRKKNGKRARWSISQSYPGIFLIHFLASVRVLCASLSSQ